MLNYVLELVSKILGYLRYDPFTSGNKDGILYDGF